MVSLGAFFGVSCRVSYQDFLSGFLGVFGFHLGSL